LLLHHAEAVADHLQAVEAEALALRESLASLSMFWQPAGGEL
jgi:hypothetical protein